MEWKVSLLAFAVFMRVDDEHTLELLLWTHG